MINEIPIIKLSILSQDVPVKNKLLGQVANERYSGLVTPH